MIDISNNKKIIIEYSKYLKSIDSVLVRQGHGIDSIERQRNRKESGNFAGDSSVDYMVVRIAAITFLRASISHINCF